MFEALAAGGPTGSFAIGHRPRACWISIRVAANGGAPAGALCHPAAHRGVHQSGSGRTPDRVSSLTEREVLEGIARGWSNQGWPGSGSSPTTRSRPSQRALHRDRRPPPCPGGGDRLRFRSGALIRGLPTAPMSLESPGCSVSWITRSDGVRCRHPRVGNRPRPKRREGGVSDDEDKTASGHMTVRNDPGTGLR